MSTQTHASPELEPVVVDMRHPAADSLRVAHREKVLQDLLDPPTAGSGYEGSSAYPNYQYAKDSGLIDMFHYDPETGKDSLIHILSGDVVTSPNGAKQIGGFHHEPSARDDDTYIDPSLVDAKPSSAKREFERVPYNPYNAHAVIRGYQKKQFRPNAEGELKETVARSSMFPNEYDPLAVMQAIRIARDSRARELDQPGRGEGHIMTEGQVTMLDGKSNMKIKLVLEKDTERVVAAWPVAKRSKMMELSRPAIRGYLGLEN